MDVQVAERFGMSTKLNDDERRNTANRSEMRMEKNQKVKLIEWKGLECQSHQTTINAIEKDKKRNRK
jgi:hypothetical protein